MQNQNPLLRPDFNVNWNIQAIIATSDTYSPPYKPNTPSGKVNCKIEEEYSYTTGATDPDGDQVFYLWDWGDGTISEWYGPYRSGYTHKTNHTWYVKGDYSIRVKAKDIHDAVSDWSDPCPLKVPYSYNKPTLPFLELLFQRFANVFPISQQLIGY